VIDQIEQIIDVHGAVGGDVADARRITFKNGIVVIVAKAAGSAREARRSDKCNVCARSQSGAWDLSNKRLLHRTAIGENLSVLAIIGQDEPDHRKLRPDLPQDTGVSDGNRESIPIGVAEAAIGPLRAAHVGVARKRGVHRRRAVAAAIGVGAAWLSFLKSACRARHTAIARAAEHPRFVHADAVPGDLTTERIGATDRMTAIDIIAAGGAGGEAIVAGVPAGIRTRRGAIGVNFADANRVPCRIAAERIGSAHGVAAVHIIAAGAARCAAIVAGVAAVVCRRANMDVAGSGVGQIAADAKFVALAGRHHERDR